tara:strand:- start:266 stop:2866 length:2601 start_codon:yes stop_codon:yes gene_type:complete
MNTFKSKKVGLKTLLPLLLLSASISAQEIEEVVVSGSFIPDEKRDTTEINVVLDSSEIERTGDDNIAVALTRLTGLSLVRGKYVYVRGLGERYSAATLNGGVLPSPEPLKRVVPLDLFPTEAIESAIVQKTYSADINGEFGGGMIAIETKAVPLERILSVSFSSGYNSVTSLSDGLLYDGGGDDDWGYDDGTRDYPASVGQAIAAGTKIDRSNFEPYQLANIAREFENSKLWVIQEGDVPVDNSFNVTFGNQLDWDLGNGLTSGFLLTAGVRTNWQTQEGLRQTGDLQANSDGTASVIIAENKTFVSTSNDVTTYGMGVFGVESDSAEAKWTSLYIHKGTKEARSITGFDPSDAANIREDYIEFFDRTLINNQLSFDKIFENDMVLDGRVSFGSASRDAPYERSVFYEDSDNDDIYLYDVNTGRNQTQFSSVDDDVFNVGLDLTIPIELESSDLIFKLGVDHKVNDREAEVRSFRFLAAGGPLPNELLGKRVDYIFADQNLDPNRLYVIENTGSSSPAGYEGELETTAYYASLEGMISDELKISAGVRSEDGTQEINTYDLFAGKDNTIDKTIDESYALPSLTLTYLPIEYENLQLRLGFSQTIARPTFRELSPTLFVDVDTDRVIAGSLYLQNSEIDNVDLRFEYYFGQNQFVTFGAFYKEIQNPIEESVSEIGDLVITSYQNVPLAEINGFEFEFERVFDGFETPWLSSKEVLVKFNYTFTDSEIVISEGDTFINLVGATESASTLLANGRDPRLQGQADNIANLQIGYNDYIANSQATLIFNYVDDRVRARGIDVLPDIIEEVPTTLDFVYSRIFDVEENTLKLSLEIRNILDESYEATMADNIFYDQYDLGTSISLGLKYNF